MPGASICLFQDFYGLDVSRGTTYFTGAAAVAFQRIYNGIGFIGFFIPSNFNGIEEAGVQTSIAVRNTKYTYRSVQLCGANDVFLFLFQI